MSGGNAFMVNYNVGGSVDEVKRIGGIKNFPDFTQPYNEMIYVDIPALKDTFQIDYETPDEDTELICVTVTATGYHQDDKFDMFCNGNQWFKNWYLSEVKEGLYMGSSTYVCDLPPKTKFKLLFHNSGTAKRLFVGFRMLKDEGGNI